MPLSPVEEIKNRLDILEVIGSYIRLQKAGRNYKARCPFHNERTPSFMVSAERQIWHCFGCGAGGDIFAFVKQIEGVEFGDALRILASRAGVKLTRQSPEIATKRQRLYEVSELAAKFFEKQLEATKTGQKAYKYLQERGLKSSTIKEWRLGWAPDQWHALSDFLGQRGYKDQEIFDAGLTVKREEENSEIRKSGDYHDRFRSRIMFPLFDIQGQIVGFAGRIFGREDQNVGKYINTPQTFLYDKSRLLYGLNFAKQELRQKDAAILVEGNLDVIMAHQAGTKNVLATSGTAMSEEHLQIIRRYTENLIFAFDIDLAGEGATRRSIDLALAQDFNVKIIKIIQDKTQGKIKDPADLIKQDAVAWRKATESAVSIMDYYFDVTFAKYKTIGVEEKRQIAKILLPAIKRIANHIERAHWLGELGKKLRVDEKALQSEMEKIKFQTFKNEAPTQTAAREASRTRTEELEDQLLSLLLNFPEQLKDFSHQPGELFFNEKPTRILEEIMTLAQKTDAKRQNCLAILKKRLPQDFCEHLDYLYFRLEKFGVQDESIEQELAACVKELKTLKLKSKMFGLNFDMQEAQDKHDKTKTQNCIKKFNELAKELSELTNNKI